MQKQTLATAVETKDGIVQRIGRSAIFTPKPNLGGGRIKWYADRPKEKKGESRQGGWSHHVRFDSYAPFSIGQLNNHSIKKELIRWQEASWKYYSHTARTTCVY